MKSRMVKYVSLLMGVLGAFNGRGCMSKRVEGSGSSKLVKKVKIKKGKSENVRCARSGRSVDSSCRQDMRGGLSVAGNLVVADVAAEVLVGVKRIRDYFIVDRAISKAKKSKELVKCGVDEKKFSEFLGELRAQTIWAYASYLDTRLSVFSSDCEHDLKKIVDSVSRSLVYLGKLFLSKDASKQEKGRGSDLFAERVIGAFFNACLDTGCIWVDSFGKMHNSGEGYPLNWKIVTPFRNYGSNSDFDYDGCIRSVVENRLKNSPRYILMGGRYVRSR